MKANWSQTLSTLLNLPQRPRRILLYGPPGTGKTRAAMESAKGHAELVTLTAGMFPDALLGKFLLKKGETFWADGPAVRAAKKGACLILDEINHAGPELASTLQAILNDPGLCVLNLDDGSHVAPLPNFCVVATMNGEPDQLPDAVLDRFDIVLNADVAADGLVNSLDADVAAFLRNKASNERSNNWTPAITPRRLMAFCALRKAIGEQAAPIIFGEENFQSVITAIVDAQRNQG